MIQRYYKGFWVIGQNQADFKTKCKKIDRNDVLGFAPVKPHVGKYIEQLQDALTQATTALRWWMESYPEGVGKEDDEKIAQFTRLLPYDDGEM